MRTVRQPVMLLVALAGGCGDGSVAPAVEEHIRQPVFSAFQERGQGVFFGNSEVFLDCVGETVRGHSEIPFRYHLTVTPNGNTILTDPFIPGTGTGTLEGLSSGTIWTLDKVVSPDVIRMTAGEMIHFTANVWWVSKTGPTLNIHSLFHISQNARGEVTSAKIDLGECRLH